MPLIQWIQQDLAAPAAVVTDNAGAVGMGGSRATRGGGIVGVTLGEKLPPPPIAQPILGEATIVLDGLRATATARVSVSASVAAKLDELTARGTATAAIAGRASTALDDLQASAAGTALITARASSTLADITVIAQGKTTTRGTLAAVFDDLGVIATAQVTTTARAQITLGDVTTVSSATALIRGALVGLLDDSSLSASATVVTRQPPDVTSLPLDQWALRLPGWKERTKAAKAKVTGGARLGTFKAASVKSPRTFAQRDPDIYSTIVESMQAQRRK